MVKIGDKFKIKNENGQYTKWAKKTWKVSHIVPYDSPAYDMGVYPQKLVEAKGLPVALYEYEIEIIK